MIRIGFGTDAHRFAHNRRLILGGVTIPFDMGLFGHSDADALSHAIADSLLGAAALGDIGSHFPDTDPAFQGISSLILLERVKKLLEDNGWEIGNIDSVLIIEKPRVTQYIDDMRTKIAGALGIDRSLVSIKATTTEGMGFMGRGEGVNAEAVSLLTGRVAG